jgi:two-component sensor histidine kinase
MVDPNAFLDDLLVQLEQSLGREHVELTWHTDSENLDVGVLTPLGLLISELVTNAYKHAFKSGGGTINVCLETDASDFVLTVTDDGLGFASDTDESKSKGLGMTLIDDLTDQIGAIRDVKSDANDTVWTVRTGASSAQT